MVDTKDVTANPVTSIADSDLVMCAINGSYHPVSFANLAKLVRNAIQVGGRNLLKNTGTWGPGWENQSGTHVVGPDKYMGLTVLHFDDAKPWNGMNQTVSIKSGEVFALSFFCKAGTAGSIRIRIMTGSGENPFYFNVPTNEWKRCTLVTSLSQTASQLRMEIGSGTAKEVCFCGVKLELGNIVTDWSPAPEDMASSWGGGVIGYLPITYNYTVEDTEKGGSHADEGTLGCAEIDRLRFLFGEPLSVGGGFFRELEKSQCQTDDITYDGSQRCICNRPERGNRTWSVLAVRIGADSEWPCRSGSVGRHAGGLLSRRKLGNPLSANHDQIRYPGNEIQDLRELERVAYIVVTDTGKEVAYAD